jgi:hypothetical protein
MRAELIQGPLSIRPALTLSSDGLLRVRLELADVTLNRQASTAAFQVVGGMPKLLASSQDLTQWSGLLAAQDEWLQRLEDDSATPEGSGRLLAAPRRTKPERKPSAVRHQIVALITTDSAAEAVVRAVCQMARPALDQVHLVTVVPTPPGLALAQTFVEAHAAPMRQLGLSVETIARALDHASLTDVLQDALADCRATLLVVGSQQLVAGMSGSHQTLLPSSFALYALRTFSLPTVIATPRFKAPGTAKSPASGSSVSSKGKQTTYTLPRRPDTPRVMMLVEGHSRPLMHYLCGMLDSGASGAAAAAGPHPKIYMAQAYNPKTCSTALASSMRMLADKFEHIAVGELHRALDAI